MRISSLAFSSNILCASPAKIFAAVVAIFFSAQLAIPLSPVPVTFQDSVILVLAFFLPLPELCWAVMCYLFLGALGLPIFAEFSGGVTVAFGLTGGISGGFCLQRW